MTGRRRLGLKSYRAFEKALKLPASGKKLFRCLVAQAEPDLFPELDAPSVASAIASLRKKGWNRSRRDLPETDAPDAIQALKRGDNLSVYAAAGRPETGASFSEIRARTRLTDASIEASLRDLERAGIVSVRDSRYFPSDLHLFLKTAGKRTDVFSELFRDGCRRASLRSQVGMKSEQELFFVSAFCVDEKRLPELKAALRATVLQFVDQAIHDEGDRIVRLVTGFHLDS